MKNYLQRHLTPVPYPRNFSSRYTGLGAQKINPKNRAVLYPKVSFFIKQIKNSFLLCEIYRKLDIFNAYLWIKYSMTEEKRGDFIKKTCTSNLNAMCLHFKNATGDHSKQIRPCLYVDQNYRFQFETVIAGKWTIIEILFIFSVEKKETI